MPFNVESPLITGSNPDTDRDLEFAEAEVCDVVVATVNDNLSRGQTAS